ncbi:MAG: hypothetical protein ACREQL_13895 [Candidatus Binatia bacterium]
MTWIHDLPHWLFAILTLSTFVGAALGGLVLARRWGRQRGLHALVDNGVTGWIFSAILTVYAIAIGLIAVAAWSNASQASSVASHEVVLVGAAIAIAASWVFSVESVRLHALLTGLLAAMIGLLVFFIASVDRPYRGRTGADPGAYELVLHQLIEHQPGR